jgi:hypothetical protein
MRSKCIITSVQAASLGSTLGETLRTCERWFRFGFVNKPRFLEDPFVIAELRTRLGLQRLKPFINVTNGLTCFFPFDFWTGSSTSDSDSVTESSGTGSCGRFSLLFSLGYTEIKATYKCNLRTHLLFSLRLLDWVFHL